MYPDTVDREGAFHETVSVFPLTFPLTDFTDLGAATFGGAGTGACVGAGVGAGVGVGVGVGLGVGAGAGAAVPIPCTCRVGLTPLGRPPNVMVAA